MKLVSVALMCFIITISTVFSQGYEKDRIWVGPTLGLGFGNLGYGAQGEYGIDDKIGFGIDIGMTGFTEDFGGFADAEFKYSLFGVLVYGAYHFTPKKKFDPFIKAGIGYFNWGFDYYVDGEKVEMPTSASAAYTSGVGFTGQIGMRYHLNNQWSARAALGYPFILSAGVDYAFGETSYKSKTRKKKKVEERAEEPEEYESNEEEYEEEYEEVVEKPKKKSGYPIFIGPYFGAKTSINTVNPEGRQNGVAFSVPDIGIAGYLPFSKSSKVGLLLELGYAPYSFVTKPYEDADDANTLTESYNYINLSPSLYLGGFIIGLNFGFPQSAEAVNNDGDVVSVLKASTIMTEFKDIEDIDLSDYLATLTEIKLGGCIALVETDNGRLNLDLQASYALSGLYDNPDHYAWSYEENSSGVVESKSDLNPKPVSFRIGLSYFFNVGM